MCAAQGVVASGGIAGIIIGGIVALVLLVVIVVYRRSRSALSDVATVKGASKPFWYTEEAEMVRSSNIWDEIHGLQEITPAHHVTDHVPTNKSKKTKRISRNEDYWTSQASINQLVRHHIHITSNHHTCISHQ